MPRYQRLSSDFGQSPWELMETLPLQRALGIAAAALPDNRPPAPGKTIRDMLAEAVDPRDIEQPLELHVEGRRRASLMRRRRGFGRDSTVDLIISPALEELLNEANLPRHVRVACVTTVRRKSYPFTWLWWEESFGGRLDPSRSVFDVEEGGRREQASFPSLEAYEAARDEAADAQGFTPVPRSLEWSDPAIDDLDLIVFENQVYVSEALAARLQGADLPALRLRNTASPSY